MKLRLFVAIALPEDIKQKFAAITKVLAGSMPEGVRFSRPENWHITLTFLGPQETESVGPILTAVKEVAVSMAMPEISFTDIAYGPVGKKPRMIWALGDAATSKVLGHIQRELNARLIEAGIPFQADARVLKAHITLARFDATVGTLPDIAQKIDARFIGDSMDLMQSELKKGGSEYILLSSFAFDDDS